MAWQLEEPALGVEARGAVEAEARAGRQVAAVEPQAAGGLGAEASGAVEAEAWAGPRVVAETWGA